MSPCVQAKTAASLLAALVLPGTTSGISTEEPLHNPPSSLLTPCFRPPPPARQKQALPPIKFLIGEKELRKEDIENMLARGFDVFERYDKVCALPPQATLSAVAETSDLLGNLERLAQLRQSSLSPAVFTNILTRYSHDLARWHKKYIFAEGMSELVQAADVHMRQSGIPSPLVQKIERVLQSLKENLAQNCFPDSLPSQLDILPPLVQVADGFSQLRACTDFFSTTPFYNAHQRLFFSGFFQDMEGELLKQSEWLRAHDKIHAAHWESLGEKLGKLYAIHAHVHTRVQALRISEQTRQLLENTHDIKQYGEIEKLRGDIVRMLSADNVKNFTDHTEQLYEICVTLGKLLEAQERRDNARSWD